MTFTPENPSAGGYALQPIVLEKQCDFDDLFEPIGCIGRGSFGTCFLARKKTSKRTVALKIVALNPLDVMDRDDPLQEVEREVQHVRRLNEKSIQRDDNDCRDLSIVFFEEWYLVQPNLLACIVMKYIPGGTLAEELERTRNTGLPYTERRIAWYALQLAEALAFAHERGVAHHDVKSANCLIDRGGGKLLLADFGSAVAPGEDSVGFTRSYAAPELLGAYERDDYTGLRPDLIDAFGLGCILYELLCSQNLTQLSGGKTLGQFIQNQGVDAALNLPIVKLPWLPGLQLGTKVGYTDALRNLVRVLLEPDPQKRSLPSSLPKPLRAERLSPLLQGYVSASHALQPGAAVTVDNVQLGMFVQRGQDWDDKDADGGIGRIGVVVRLDPDAHYTEVAWSHFDSQQLGNDGFSHATCYRIGAGDKFELQVGPTPLRDFISGTDQPVETGLIRYNFDDISSRYPGEKLNENCIVVGIHEIEKRLVVAPLEPISIVNIAQPAPFCSVVEQATHSRNTRPPPETWEHDDDLLVEVGEDTSERSEVLDALFSTEGGLNIQQIEVVSIKRVEASDLWNSFAEASDTVAAENWGIPNQQRFFIGPRNNCPERFLRSGSSDFFAGMFGCAENMRLDMQAKTADLDAYRNTNGVRTLILARVALGRELRPATTAQVFSPTFHSSRGSKSHLVRKTVQAYPEYFIYFKNICSPLHGNRRCVRAVRPWEKRQTAANIASPRAALPQDAESNDPGSLLAAGFNALSMKSPSKQCVVCLDNPVKRVLVPCGHLCLCQTCSTEHGLAKLRRKCPECRSTISQAVSIYGRVVDD